MNKTNIQLTKARHYLAAANKAIDFLASMDIQSDINDNLFRLITAADPLEYFDECITKTDSYDPIHVATATRILSGYLIKLADNPDIFNDLVALARMHLNLPAVEKSTQE